MCQMRSKPQNRLEDVQALLAFLRCVPLSDPAVWKANIGVAAAAGDPAGLARLRVGVRSVCLRRTKVVKDPVHDNNSVQTSWLPDVCISSLTF